MGNFEMNLFFFLYLFLNFLRGPWLCNCASTWGHAVMHGINSKLYLFTWRMFRIVLFLIDNHKCYLIL